jgi:hypothetical protein
MLHREAVSRLPFAGDKEVTKLTTPKPALRLPFHLFSSACSVTIVMTREGSRSRRRSIALTHHRSDTLVERADASSR